MSERMTDDGFERAVTRACEGGSVLLLAREAERARTSEHEKTLENARLLNEREETGRTIKALADALEKHGAHSETCPKIRIDRRRGPCVCGLDAALRLAGRL